MRQVRISVEAGSIRGDLSLPPSPCGVVLFAHGSGSSRLSDRNRFVARALNEAKWATLLIDLLTAEEEDADRFARHLRFDIGLLAERMVVATRWLEQDPQTAMLPIGYFGASTGAAAALAASTRFPSRVVAVVSRGGRPDLAGDALARVTAPTLLIVGSEDDVVIELNKVAAAEMQCTQRLEIVEGATHLFEEAGTLEKVATLTREWFLRHGAGWCQEEAPSEQSITA